VGTGSTVCPPVKFRGLVNVDCDGSGRLGGGPIAFGEFFGGPMVGDGIFGGTGGGGPIVRGGIN
jgi:hypothetical protein